MFLYQLTDAFKKANLPYALIGGYALALHGIVRATMDVDFVLSLNVKDFELAEKTLGELGLQSRLPLRGRDIINMREEYIANRNLLAWSFVDFKQPMYEVDILITKDLRKLQTEKISVAGRKISVVTLQQLLKLKLETGRPQDLVDAESIREKLRAR